MLIANQKKKENIAEYVIYMFQVETIIRSFDFKIDDIFDHYISVMTSIEEAREDVKKWYIEIIEEMKSKDLKEKGHIAPLRLESVYLQLSANCRCCGLWCGASAATFRDKLSCHITYLIF